MKRSAYFRGKIVPLEKININPYDLGFLRGYGVFDVMKTVNNKPFLLDDHWQRFCDSAKELGLRVPISRHNYEKVIKKLLKLNGYRKSTIRTVLSGGCSPNGFDPAGKETFIIIIEEFSPLPEKIFQHGAKVITLEHLRDLPRAKVTNYIMAIKHLKKKLEEKAIEILYTCEGHGLEASTSNFFIVKNGIIITPLVDILFGVTRKVVIKIAKKTGFKVLERKVKIQEVYAADEVFLTATNKDIVPIVKVNNKKIGNGKVGKVTKFLMEELANFLKKY
jgi:branched-chain amino acid aminotransferase